VRITSHFSGNLLDYLEDKHPDFLDRIRELVGRGQVDIMGGGYYEPIFQAIPQADRIGQIDMLSTYCRRRFGKIPAGMWIPERVWSPELIGDFHSLGMRYAVLDDTHFLKAGIKKADTYGYFVTGKKDSRISIFPADKALRYIIPFKKPREIIDYFKGIAKKKKGYLLTYGDDGEKFGEWPWTYDWVYKRGWLDKFFKELTKSRDLVDIVTFSEYLDSHPPLQHVDVPESSYEEMLDWSGGSWMNFLSKYPESNQMHKRMMYVSGRVNQLVNSSQFTVYSKRLDEARRELYKGQCNCSYWHGVFGGIYLHHLREAIYRHLINADRIADDVEHESQDRWVNIKDIDFYRRGTKAVIFENKDFFICIDPSSGGAIRELDYKPKSFNLINTLARRREWYHKKILDRFSTKIAGLFGIYEASKSVDRRIKKGIFYDKYDRVCLLDHFIDRDLKKDDFENCNYVELGDFAASPYTARIEKGKIVLVREGNVEQKPIMIAKTISPSSECEVRVSYDLANRGNSTIDTLFGIEFNVSLPYTDSELENGSFTIKDSQGGLGIRLIFSETPEKIWYFPVKTVSQSERSYDLNYQSACIFPIWPIELGAKKAAKFDIICRMK